MIVCGQQECAWLHPNHTKQLCQRVPESLKQGEELQQTQDRQGASVKMYKLRCINFIVIFLSKIA